MCLKEKAVWCDRSDISTYRTSLLDIYTYRGSKSVRMARSVRQTFRLTGTPATACYVDGRRDWMFLSTRKFPGVVGGRAGKEAIMFCFNSFRFSWGWTNRDHSVARQRNTPLLLLLYDSRGYPSHRTCLHTGPSPRAISRYFFLYGTGIIYKYRKR